MLTRSRKRKRTQDQVLFILGNQNRLLHLILRFLTCSNSLYCSLVHLSKNGLVPKTFWKDSLLTSLFRFDLNGTSLEQVQNYPLRQLHLNTNGGDFIVDVYKQETLPQSFFSCLRGLSLQGFYMGWRTTFSHLVNLKELDLRGVQLHWMERPIFPIRLEILKFKCRETEFIHGGFEREPGFCYLTCLKTLKMQITGFTHIYLKVPPSLTYLKLDYNGIGYFQPPVANLNKLTLVSGDFRAFPRDLGDVCSIKLSGCTLSTLTMWHHMTSNLAKFPSLTSLDVIARDFQSLSTLKLKHLRFTPQYGNFNISLLTQMTSLQCLYIHKAWAVVHLLETILQCSHLRTVELRDCPDTLSNVDYCMLTYRNNQWETERMK